MSLLVFDPQSAPLTEIQVFWRDHLTAWQATGDTLAAYALAHGMPAKRLYTWQARLITCGLWSAPHPTPRAPRPTPPAAVRFARLVTAPVAGPAPSPQTVRLELPT